MFIIKITVLDFGDCEVLKRETIIRDFLTTTGNNITITLYYNRYDEYIYMDITDITGKIIESATKLVQGEDLIYRIGFKTQGDVSLIITPTSDEYKNDKVTPNNLGKTLDVVFYEL